MKYKVTFNMECVQEVEALDQCHAMDEAMRNAVNSFTQGGCTMQLVSTLVQEVTPPTADKLTEES